MNTLLPLALIAFYLLLIIGWVMNIIQIVAIATQPITGMFILKCIGIIAAPLGSILGWIG